MQVNVSELKMRLGNADILNSVHMDAEGHCFVGIIGPNGSGKSTLLKCIYRTLQPTGGAVYLDGKPLSGYSMKDSAKKVGVVAQHNQLSFDFTVLDIVMMGRSPHKRTFEGDNAEDYRLASEALDAVEMSGYEKRSYTTLSGGEQQRVILARALAQQTQCLILDEPTNHMDIKYQLQLMSLVKGLGLTVISAIHDLNIAAMYCDRIYVLKDGCVVAYGEPGTVLTAGLISDVYGVSAKLITDDDGYIHVLYNPGARGGDRMARPAL